MATNNSRRIHGRDITVAASTDNKKKRGIPWGNDYGVDTSEYDEDNDDEFDESLYDGCFPEIDGPSDNSESRNRSSKRLKMAERNHKSSRTETGHKRFQPSRNARALQPVNPNRGGQRRPPTSYPAAGGAAINNGSNATGSKVRSIVVAKPSQLLNQHQNSKKNEAMRIVSASVAAKNGGHPARSQQLTASAKAKTNGQGTASDPLCLFSDGEDEEDHHHDDDDEDHDEDGDDVDVDDDVVIIHQSRGRQSVAGKAKITKKRRSRSYLSSPVPHRSSSRTRTAGPGASDSSIAPVDRKLLAVQSFRPPQRYSDVPTGVTNIDKIKVNDPLHAVDYVEDMYTYHRKRELEESTDGGITYLASKKEYRSMQPHINEKMRSILVDWLIEVHYKFKLFESTLYLTINIVDRFLEKSRKTPKRDLQLVGVTSLLIASKYEELYIPELRDLTYICDDAYTADQVRCSWVLLFPTAVAAAVCC